MPVDEVCAGGGLTSRAEEDVVAADTFSPDGRPTPGTWFSLSVPDTQVIPNFLLNGSGRLLHFVNAPLQHGANRFVQILQCDGVKTSHQGFGMNACFEQNFIRVRVSDGAYNRLIVDEDPNLLPSVMGGDLLELLRRECRREDVDSLSGKAGDSFVPLVGGEIDLRHFLPVTEVEYGSVVQRQRQAEIRFRRFSRLEVLDSSREHEVDDQFEVRGEEEVEEWSAEADFPDSVSSHHVCKGALQEHPDHDRLPHLGLENGTPGDAGVKIVFYVDEIRDFWH